MMLWDKTLAISTCLDKEIGPQTFPNYVIGWNSGHFYTSGWRNGSTNFSKWCFGIKIWQFSHVWMKKWVHRHLQMILWGETLAISTYLDEEIGPQTSPNDVVWKNFGHFHISEWRNRFTDISKWCCGVKLWLFPQFWMKKWVYRHLQVMLWD